MGNGLGVLKPLMRGQVNFGPAKQEMVGCHLAIRMLLHLWPNPQEIRGMTEPALQDCGLRIIKNKRKHNKQLSLLPTFAQQATSVLLPTPWQLVLLLLTGNNSSKGWLFQEVPHHHVVAPLTGSIRISCLARGFELLVFVLNSFPRNVKHHQGHWEWDTLFSVLCSESLLFIHKCVISSAGAQNQGTLNRRAECRVLPTLPSSCLLFYHPFGNKIAYCLIHREEGHYSTFSTLGGTGDPQHFYFLCLV